MATGAAEEWWQKPACECIKRERRRRFVLAVRTSNLKRIRDEECTLVFFSFDRKEEEHTTKGNDEEERGTTADEEG